MNNKDYWARRFKIMEDALKDKSYEYVKNLEKQYDKAIKELNLQILAWYQRFADNNEITYAQAQKLLTSDELKEFKWDVFEYIKKGKENAINGAWVKELENASARVHISRLESLKIQLRQHAEELTQARIKATTDASKLSYIESYNHTAFEVQRGLGLGWNFQSVDTRRLEKVLSRPWTVDNQTFTARCWTDKTKLVETVNRELTRMLAIGEAPDKAIANIAKQFKVSKQNAGRVVMTESAYFASAAQKDCFEELGVEQYRIIGTLDEGTCDTCVSMDGKVFDMKDFTVGSTAPPFHPWCRCCTAPYFADMEGVGERFARDKDGKTYSVPKDMSYEQWREKQNKKVEKSEESGIINLKKSVEIPPDCQYLLKADTNFEDKDISTDILKTINDTIEKRFSETGDFIYDEIKIAKFPKGDKSVFITNLEARGTIKRVQLYLNKDYFIGKSKLEIDTFCDELYVSNWWKSKSLEDLVNHEIMHARINYNNSFEKVERMYQTLSEDSRVKGFCRLVDNDPSEFMNEMYVALNRNENIDQSYIDVFKEYEKEFLGGD